MKLNIKVFLVFGLTLAFVSFCFAQIHEIIFTTVDPNDSRVMPLLGVIAGPDPNCENSDLPNLTSQYQDIGVMFVRNNDYYDDRLDMERMFRCSDTSSYPSWRCNPDDPQNLHFEGSDEQFQSYLDGGFIPFFRLGGEYGNCLNGHDYKGPRDSLERINWIRAALHVVDHYDHFNGRNNVLTYLNIWTEFPGSHFWSWSNQEFYDFWIKAYDSLKIHFPHLLIGGPGFVPKSTLDVINGEQHSLPVEFLTELYNHYIKPDWIGWHFWDNDPVSYMKAANQFRDLLDGEGDFADVPWAGTGFFQGVKQYVDAYGTSTTKYVNGQLIGMNKVSRDSIYNKQKGAAILTGQWIAMQYTDVELACYYRGSPQHASSPNDDPHDPSTEIGGSSLFHGDSIGSAKPTANAFRFWSRIYHQFPTLLQGPVPSVNDQGDTLWALAAKNDNEYAVLIANLKSHSQGFSLALEGKPVNLQNFQNIKIYQVDDNDDGKTGREWNSSQFIIPGYTVQLITITLKTVGIEANSSVQASPFTVTANNVVNNQILKLSVTSPQNIRISITIYNILGQKVFSRSAFDLVAGKQTIDIRLPQLPNGIYFAQIKSHFNLRGVKFLVRH